MITYQSHKSHKSHQSHSPHPRHPLTTAYQVIILLTSYLFLLTSLTSCVDEEEFANTPQGNFEALWKIIDEHYCFFDYKQHEYGLDTVLYDERLTTVEAHYALNQTNTRGSKRKAVVDAVSAVIILEDYMKHKHNQGETDNV